MPSNWVDFGEVAIGVGRAIPGEFLRGGGDVAAEEKEDGVWAISSGGVCGDFCLCRAATEYASDESLV